MTEEQREACPGIGKGDGLGILYKITLKTSECILYGPQYLVPCLLHVYKQKNL